MKFEVIKKPGRVPRWRLRDEQGKLVTVKLGSVALPPTPEENRLSREAVDLVLTRMAADGAAVSGG